MEPASTIIRKLGGGKVVAAITGRALTAPYRWQHAREKGGTGGLIPQKYHRLLLDYARRNGIGLRATDFVAPDGASECAANDGVAAHGAPDGAAATAKAES
jgi:hypothetical protein